MRNAGKYATVNSKFNPSIVSIYDLWSAYAYLGDKHDGKVYGDTNVKEFIDRYLDVECNHSLTDETTVEEQAAYIVYYVDNCMTKIAKDIFGSKALGGSSKVVDLALSFEGENHSRFTDKYNIKADWCAMFVSYCFDECGLIPSVLPKPYFSCTNGGIPMAKEAGRFRNKIAGDDYIPKPGDIIFFTKNGGATSHHTGIVTDCDGVNVYTIEGNTGNSSTSPYWKGSKVETDDYNLSAANIYGYWEM